MKKYIFNFLKRGVMFAFGGPVVLSIVWLSLWKAGIIENLTVSEVIIGILSTTVLALVAAGITVIYQIESLPKLMAGLIHALVLYLGYLGIYLINGWMKSDNVWIFTLAFFGGFALIWFVIYISVKMKVDKMNKIIKKKTNE